MNIAPDQSRPLPQQPSSTPVMPPFSNVSPQPPRVASTVSGRYSDRTYENTIVLSYVFGFFGVDRFYLGKVVTGILKLVTFGGLGVWYYIDLIYIALGKARDDEGLLLQGSEDPHKLVQILSIIYAGLSLASMVLYLVFFAFIATFAGDIQKALTEAAGPTNSEQRQAPAAPGAGAVDPQSNAFTLNIASDGCSVSRNTPANIATFEDLGWNVLSKDGFTVGEQSAQDSTTYRYNEAGKYTLSLTSIINNEYVQVSNEVEVNC